MQHEFAPSVEGQIRKSHTFRFSVQFSRVFFRNPPGILRGFCQRKSARAPPKRRAASFPRRPMELVTGATGYIGGRLVDPPCERRGRAVGAALARDTRRAVEPQEGRRAPRRATSVSGEGLDAALDGVKVAYYLITFDGAVAERPRHSPTSTAAAPRTSRPPPRRRPGSRKVIYLGGVRRGGTGRPVAAPRLAGLEVEQILMEAAPRGNRVPGVDRGRRGPRCRFRLLVKPRRGGCACLPFPGPGATTSPQPIAEGRRESSTWPGAPQVTPRSGEEPRHRGGLTWCPTGRG